MKFVLGGIIALLLAIMVAPQLNLQGNILGALLIVAFGFLCVALGRKLYTPNFMWVLWLPQFSMLLFCLLAFVVKLDFPLLFLVWSVATSLAAAVAWWARGLANPALGPGVART